MLLSITIEGKGGTAKSTLTSLFALALRGDGTRAVLLMDGDTTNSTTAMTYPEAELIDFGQPESIGQVVAKFKAPADALVIDTGARDEARILRMLPLIVPRAEKAKVTMLQIRPVTLSSFVQANIVTSVEMLAPLGVRTVMVQVHAQGRTEGHFADWQRSAGRKKALDLGAVEVAVSDVGVRWMDEAVGCGLTPADIAFGDFSKVPAHLQAVAAGLFTEGIQYHMAMWLESNGAAMLSALKALGIKI